MSNKQNFSRLKEEYCGRLTQFNLGRLYSGVCLLKFIIRESRLYTNITTSIIWTKLPNLYFYMHTVENKITKFNAYVLLQIIDTVSFWGETALDLLTNLFQGYISCTDKLFVEYI